MIDKKFNTIRSWEECKKQWQEILNEKIHACENSDKPWERSCADTYRLGRVPMTWPPTGIELSIDEYLQFKAEYRKFEEIQGWCRTGKDVHAHYKSLASWKAGEYNPREGYYKIVKAPYQDSLLEAKLFQSTAYMRAMNGDADTTLTCTFCDCYYNCLDGETFIEEPVTIRLNPLYNRDSHSYNGPRIVNELREGQIIHIIRVTLIDKSYEIEWEIV